VSTPNSTSQDLVQAVQKAMAGDWHGAHEIAQEYNDVMANWLHAVLHKIEPDEWNSRYWYKRSQHQYEDYADPDAELAAILTQLSQ
jgi:hypothetical protein